MKYSVSVLIFFSFFIMLENTSCTTGNKYPKETQTLDSLKVLVAKADSGVKMMDSAKIKGCIEAIMRDLQLLNMWHVDSMSGGAATIFRDFSGIRYALMSDAGKKRPLLTELEKSQKQLIHLSHDLQHNLVATDSVAFYVSFESKKAAELIQVSFMSVDDVNKQLPLYTFIAPKADSLMSLLKEHKKI